jgi:hypothetical protein
MCDSLYEFGYLGNNLICGTNPVHNSELSTNARAVSLRFPLPISRMDSTIRSRFHLC